MSSKCPSLNPIQEGKDESESVNPTPTYAGGGAFISHEQGHKRSRSASDAQKSVSSIFTRISRANSESALNRQSESPRRKSAKKVTTKQFLFISIC
jgi:hypothetical protein